MNVFGYILMLVAAVGRIVWILFSVLEKCTEKAGGLLLFILAVTPLIASADVLGHVIYGLHFAGADHEAIEGKLHANPSH